MGGLLQFERWGDRRTGGGRSRLPYVSPTTAQLRDALSLTEAQPPGRVVLSLPGCDPRGCSIVQFQQLLQRAHR